MKCTECGSQDIQIIDKEGLEHYKCSDGHENERVIENEGLKYYRDGEIVHRSVGAIIVNGKDILLLKRRKFPFKYTIPAGHLEEGEQPEKAVLREIKEETGIEASKSGLKQIFKGKIDDKCRRGANKHDWNLYLVEKDEKEEVFSNDESEESKWINISEITDKELTEPTKKFILEKELLRYQR